MEQYDGKVVVIGGSFCPPTLAHLALAKAAKAASGAGLCLLVPVPYAYFTMRRKNLQFEYERLSDEMRLDMLGAMIRDCPGILVDSDEMKLGKPNQTYESLRRVQAKYPRAEVSFVIGSDKLPEMNRWPTATALLSEFYVLVTARNGEDVPAILAGCGRLAPYADRFTAFRMTDGWSGVSSTRVRELMRGPDFEQAQGYLNPEVYRVLRSVYGHGKAEPSRAEDLKPIDSFRGEYDFLSNFYEASVFYGGLAYRNNEAAFQAQKALSAEERGAF